MKNKILIGISALILLVAFNNWRTDSAISNTSDPEEIAKLVLIDGTVNTMFNEHNGSLAVTHTPDATYSTKAMIDQWHYKTTKLIPTTFKQSPQVKQIRYNLFTNFTDSKGNTKTQKAASLDFKRGTADRINWEVVDQDNMKALADDYFLRLAIRRELTAK